MTTTYYVVLSQATDEATPAQQRKHGTPQYGYQSLKVAIRYCPIGYYVQERHMDGRDDWAGNIVFSRDN